MLKLINLTLLLRDSAMVIICNLGYMEAVHCRHSPMDRVDRRAPDRPAVAAFVAAIGVPSQVATGRPCRDLPGAHRVTVQVVGQVEVN